MSGKYKLDSRNADIAVRMLERVTSIFEDHGIKYVLTAGTLLGIYRENRLLPWDNDMDLRVFREDDNSSIWVVAVLSDRRLTCRVEGEGGVSFWEE